MTRRRTLAAALLLGTLVGCNAQVGGLAPGVPEKTVVSSPEGGPAILTFDCTPQSAPAPHDVSCAWTASHPDSIRMTCSLDVGVDGSADAQGDCAEVTSHAFQIATEAITEVRLSVHDDRGKSVEARVSLTTSANLPPVLSGFTATPEVGFAPHAVSFGWTVSDPEGGTVACAVDFESDGTADVTIADCVAEPLTMAQFDVPATRMVTLTATDDFGNAVSATAQVVTNAPPTVDLSLSKVEFGQTVFGENLRLVEGKRALFRAHVLSNEEGTAAPIIRLTATANGTALGTVDLTGPAAVPRTEDAAQLGQSYITELPDSWVQSGLELTVTIDPENALPEVDEANNARVVKPTIGVGTVLYLTAVPVVHQGVTATIPNGYTNTVWRIWPVKDVQTVTRAPYTYGGTLSGSSGSAWSNLLQNLASVRASDGSARYYYGFVDVSYSSGIAGIGYVGAPTSTGRNDSLQTLVHELGHNFGRQHAPCGTTGDPNYPYANARLGSWGYIIDAMRLVAPNANYDLMSYCRPSWVSDYNYGRVQAYLEQKPPQSLVQQGDEPLMLISGSVTADSAELLPIFRVTAPSRVIKEGPYTLRLYTSEGVRDFPFDTVEVEDRAERHFTLLVPESGTLIAAEVRRGDVVLGQLNPRRAPAMRSAPVVREANGKLRVLWDAAAYPYLRVQHLGAERTTLTLWLRGGDVELPLEGLQAGGEWELGLSDGVNAVRWRAAR